MKRVRRLFELTLVMCAVIMAVGTFGCLLFAKQLMQYMVKTGQVEEENGSYKKSK